MEEGSALRKYQVVNVLAAGRTLRNLLEISTPVTGQTFAEALASGLYARADRLVYRCPEGFDDGLPIRFRVSEPSSGARVRELLRESDGVPPYDVVFVDPWHTWWCSMTDLLGAWLLVRPGGAIVVHDCSPATAELAGPDYTGRPWCGLTYQAYLDFVASGVTREFFTVSADYGIGVLFKPENGAQTGRPWDASLERAWIAASAGGDPFGFFDDRRSDLLRLVAEESFLDRYARMPEET